MSNYTSSSTTTTLVGASLVVTVGTLFVLRAIKRSRSPVITSQLCCPCGTIQATIRTKVEDTVRLHCYCQDCRTYATFLDHLNDKSNNKASCRIIHDCGESHLVQVCKDAITIDQGLECMKLCRKASPNKGMFRYYASCCNTPLMNTWDILGFVGIYDDLIDDEKENFYGPFRCYDDEATQSLEHNTLPGLPIPRLLWNLVRYLPYRNKGPFDYNLQPIYWDETKKQE